MVTYAAEETVRPERTIPRALMLGIVVVTVCYVGAERGLSAACCRSTAVLASTRVAADAFDAG